MHILTSLMTCIGLEAHQGPGHSGWSQQPNHSDSTAPKKAVYWQHQYTQQFHRFFFGTPMETPTLPGLISRINAMKITSHQSRMRHLTTHFNTVHSLNMKVQDIPMLRELFQ